MPFYLQIWKFCGKACLAFTAYLWVAPLCSAQLITTSAAQSPSSAASNDDFTVWYVALGVLSLGFFASIFWWRREKTKTQTLPLNRPSANNRPARSTNGEKSRSAATDTVDEKDLVYAARRQEIEIDADTESWIKDNVGKQLGSQKLKPQPQTAAQPAIQQMVQPAEYGAKITPIIAIFQLPPASKPLVPLPTTNDEFLMTAVEQIQEFDATEDEREVAVKILSKFRTQNAVEALTSVAHYDESSRLRIAAIDSLAAFDHESVFEPILVACADIAREVRAAAARTLSRLNFDRTEAFSRIVESGDSERRRLTALACLDAGLVSHAFSRLIHPDRKQANEAFSIIRLLAAAEQFAPVIETISRHDDNHVRLATIQALRILKPANILPNLQELAAKDKLPADIGKALDELIDRLRAA